jgi:hypothetical protein
MAPAPRELASARTRPVNDPRGLTGVTTGGGSAGATGEPMTGGASVKATSGVTDPAGMTVGMTVGMAARMGHEARDAATGPGAEHRVRRPVHLMVDGASRTGTRGRLAAGGPGLRSAVAARD